MSDPRDIPVLTDAVKESVDASLCFDAKAVHAAILTETLELADSLLHQAARDIEATLFERDRLDIGALIDGPAIVEQFDATTVIPPGWRAQVDRRRNLILEKREA